MSTSLENIVIGFDGFERKEGLPALAAALAKQHGAQLHVVHVAPEQPSQGWWSRDARSREIFASDIESRRDRLEQLVARPRKNGIEARTVIRHGVPHVELIREAMRVDADLVIVADELVDRRGRRGFGTVTRQLLRACPVPVLARRGLRKSKLRAIVASLDLEPTPGGPELNQSILEMTAALAERANGRVTVFHAWELWGEHLLHSKVGMSIDEIRSLQEEAKRAREDEATRLLAATFLAGIDVRVELQEGEVRDLLPVFVEDKKVDLVVMGTVGRRGLRGAIMGNTAERVLNELSCSVLAVKPEGFQGPIDIAD